MVTRQLVELRNVGSNPAVGGINNLFVFKIMLYEYIPIHIGLGIASLISFIFLSLSYILSTAKQQLTFEKLSTYECGFQPFEDSRHLFNISFYLIGILFVIFDLEIVFLFPWCVTVSFLNFFGYKIFVLFMFILIIDFFMNYEKAH